MKNKEIFVQESPSSCGACSIASIVSHYGGYVPLEIIMEDTFTDKNGTNALNIKRTLEKYGFECMGLKLNLSELKTYQFPLIAHISKDGYEHFLVIYGMYEDKVDTMDPAVGKKAYTLKEFASITTKTFISAVPRGTIPKYASSKSLLGILDPFMRKSTKSTRLILLASLVILFLSLIVSFHLKIFDKSDNLGTSLFILIVIEIIVAFIEYLRTFILTGLIKNVDDESIHEFERHIFHLPIKNIKNKRVGEIIKKIEDMTFVKDLFIKFTIETPLDILTVFVIGLLMSILSLKMTLIYSLIIVVYLSLTIVGNKDIFKREKRVQQKRENYMGTLVEYLDGLESIKNLNGEAKFLKDLESSLKEFTEEKKRGDRKYGVISILKSKIFGISIIIADFVGFTMLSNSFTFVDLLTISSLYGVFHSSCEKIADTLILYSKYRAVLRNVSEFYDLETEASATSLKPKLNRVRIDDLSFSYNRIDYTLKNFSYEFNIGENLIIKGPSGVGKSTLVKCLSAYNRDYDGNIYFDDKSLKGLNAGYIRKNVIYIGQEERLFTKTIKENVTLGEYDEKWFDRVSKMTKLDAIIDKKRDGARAMLLEGASNLSGGERARVVLARALYQNPRILIIDETLSNVGESDEDEILKNLLSLKNISIIYITHRKKEYLFDNIIEFRKDGRYDITRKRSHRN